MENQNQPSVHQQDVAETPVVAAKTSFLSPVDMVVGGLFVVAIAVCSWLLVSASSSAFMLNDVSHSDSVRDTGMLTIAYDQPLETYDPTETGVIQRAYLSNVYEGLVRFDRDFNIEPALALSWGMLDETTWQFKLRPNVQFHDGSTFDAEDVEAALSGMNGVEDIDVVDDLTVLIETEGPDPTFLQELTLEWITPAEESLFRAPVGSGPYQFLTADDDVWRFQRFDEYWGDTPSFPELELRYEPDKQARWESFISGEFDVLGQVPPVAVDPILSLGHPIASLPTLEVSFLVFNWEDDDSPFRHEELRRAVASSIDSEYVSGLASDYAHSVNQFVSRGVFGYAPDLEGVSYDLDYAEEQMEGLGKRWTVTLDLPEGFDVLGDYVVDQLDRVGIEVEVDYWGPSMYKTLLESGDSDFYFLAWRNDLGDAGDFFENVVYGNYGDGIDRLIEIANRNLLESVRQEQLQSLMETVVSDEVMGVPLFETDSLVAIQSDLDWEPRMDNLILASDIR